MPYVKRIDGYDIKDAEARESITALTGELATAKQDSATVKTDSETAKTQASTNATEINGLKTRVSNLEQKEHLTFVYDAANEEIKFE